MKINAQKITTTLKIFLDLGMPITHIIINTAFAIIAVVDAPAHVKPPSELQMAQLQKRLLKNFITLKYMVISPNSALSNLQNLIKTPSKQKEILSFGQLRSEE